MIDTGDTTEAPEAGAGRYYRPSDFVPAPETPENFEGRDSVKRAATELGERRQQPAPIKKRDARTLPREMKIRDAADSLKLTRQTEAAIDMVSAGVDQDAAVQAVRDLVARRVEGDAFARGVPNGVIEQMLRARAIGGYCRCRMPAILEKERLAANLS
jgi:hypothetical protein